ncbi:uncharacterized protein G2W53_032556 [Senna tora]|uniref:Uncharacterized protein n=1 Tax=Senna tora TaxID=362788 RepID=A0A834W6E8_9FABA|nr:uncharacterized protein G2W53_032556 [Senna tora]
MMKTFYNLPSLYFSQTQSTKSNSSDKAFGDGPGLPNECGLIFDLNNPTEEAKVGDGK